jgi:hypothetical protein
MRGTSSFSSKGLFPPKGVVGGLGKGLSSSDIIPSLDASSFYYTTDERGKSGVCPSTKVRGYI